MEPNSLKWVGSPCGLHGPYVFYKAFKFNLEGKPRILSLGDFFFVRCKPGDPICIAELQLLWEERTSKQLLSSSKLYFLPEDTPQGRTVCHGEDEIVAVSEKVIVKLDNLVKWTVSDASRWRCGLKAVALKPSILKELGNNGRRDVLHKYRESTLNSGLNFKDVLKEKAELGDDEEGKKVLVLSYPQYCRYRSVIARLRERPSSLLMDQVVLALGGIASLNANTRILYCRDTFEHPTLIQNESISEEFAPNLKGRPRKKKPSVSQRRDSQVPAKDSGYMDTSVPAKVKSDVKAVVAKPRSSGGGWRKVPSEEQDQARPAKAEAEAEGEEQAFLVSLYKYMKERGTPIERIPYLGFKQINLWTMFQAAQKLGGYEPITGRRQWKNVYDELGGNPGSTSAATCTRRHYERLLLPYERHMKGEEDKPLPLVKPRRPEPGVQEGDDRVKATLGKRLKVPQSYPASGETNAFTKSPRPSTESDSGEESAELTVQAAEETKSQDEDEEEEQLGAEKEALYAGACEKETPPRRISDEDGVTERLSADPARPRAGPETQALSLLDEDSAVETFSPESRLCHVHDRPASIPDCTAPGCDGTANETHEHVGLVPSTPKPPQAPKAAEAPQDDDNSRFSLETGPPPAADPVIMSPLAKKKLLSQVSISTTPANCYPFSPPSAYALANHNGRIPHGPGVAVSRPSVIQRAQSFKPLAHRKQEVTSELFQRDLAEPGTTVGPYPAEKRMGPLTNRVPSGFPNFYPAHPLLGLYRQGEHCLGREASFTQNEGNRPRFTPHAHPERTRLGYRLPLTEGNPAYGEVPSDEEPTDLSLPKPFPHTPCSSRAGPCCPALQPPHRDCGPDFLPKSCRVPPMTVPSVPRKPQDPPPPPARTLGKDTVLGRHFACASRPPRRTLEELERGPPEKKIRAVTPMHPARAHTPEPDAQDKPGDGLAEGHKFPVRGPLFPPLYPGAQEACDRYPHPLQCLKSQAMVSPLLPPLALHSLMVQRQLLASAAAPHLYRHPGGASYGDLLHHGLFPMSSLNPPPTYSPPQLPSLHPSTKL